jgi:hypothetical protein
VSKLKSGVSISEHGLSTRSVSLSMYQKAIPAHKDVRFGFFEARLHFPHKRRSHLAPLCVGFARLQSNYLGVDVG